MHNLYTQNCIKYKNRENAYWHHQAARCERNDIIATHRWTEFETPTDWLTDLPCVCRSRQSRCTSECGRSWQRPDRLRLWRPTTRESDECDRASTRFWSSRPPTTTRTSVSLVTRWKSEETSTRRDTASPRRAALTSGTPYCRTHWRRIHSADTATFQVVRLSTLNAMQLFKAN